MKEISLYRFFNVLILKEKSKGSFSGEEIIEIEVPKQNGVSMASLLGLIDKKIKIKNNDDAKIFFDAFSVLHRNFRVHLSCDRWKEKTKNYLF